MRVTLEQQKVADLLADRYSQQDIADYYSKDGFKCSRSKVQAFIREHNLGKTLGNISSVTPNVTLPDQPKTSIRPDHIFVPNQSIDANTALFYEQKETARLLRELDETKRRLEAITDKYDKAKEENRDLKEDARIQENKKPSALNGVVESTVNNLPQIINAVISGIAAARQNGQHSPPTSGVTVSSDAQAMINLAIASLSNEAGNLIKLEKLVTLIQAACLPVSENWLNQTIEMMKQQP